MDDTLTPVSAASWNGAAPMSDPADAPASDADESFLTAAALAVQRYLNEQAPPGIVRDPWDRALDGLLVRVHVARWQGDVHLTPQDLGLDASRYAELTRHVRWGALRLAPDPIGRKLESLETRFRRLPERWGVVVHWGRFVPARAWPDFQREWNALLSDWSILIDQWEDAYDDERALAEARITQFAHVSAMTARQLGIIAAVQVDAWERRLVARLMDSYPSRATLRQRFAVSYETAIIPQPSLLAAEAERVALIQERQRLRLEALRRQAALQERQDELERLRLEAAIDAETQRLRMREAVLRDELERMRQGLQAQAQQLIASFEATYARQIRERLHDSLVHLIAAVRAGRITPMATRSVRQTIRQLRAIAMGDDTEIDELLNRLQAVVGDRRDADSPPPAAIQQMIEDVGVLLQTSIVALGGALRAPKGMSRLPIDVTAGDDDLASLVRGAVRRLGVTSSLAATLVEDGALTRADLRRLAARTGADAR